LLNADIVLSTYAVVESAFRKQQSGFKRQGQTIKEKSLIHSINWGRAILDEAHSIKDRTCSTARAVFALKSNIRWSLSGNNHNSSANNSLNSQARRCRTVWENYTPSFGSWTRILSVITFANSVPVKCRPGSSLIDGIAVNN
jgi:hypothetical protein